MIARIVGLPRWAQALGLIAIGIALFLVWDWFDDRAAVERNDAKREAAAGEAREQSANRRMRDAVENAQSEQEMHDAIEHAPASGALSPAAHALACERLRRIGRIPAACRPDGGDRGQTDPR